MRWLLVTALLIGACKRDAIGVDPDTDPDTGVDTDIDTDVGTDSDTDPDTAIPSVVTPSATPVGGGATRLESERFTLTITAGTPTHTHALVSPNYRLTVGVLAPGDAP